MKIDTTSSVGPMAAELSNEWQPLSWLSQSTLSAADACFRRLQYNLEVPIYHGGIVRAIGTAYHKGLETYYGNSETQLADVWDAARDELERITEMGPSHWTEHDKQPGRFNWDDKFPDLGAATKALRTMLQAWWEHSETRWDQAGAFACVDVEVNFTYGLWDDVTARGSIDLVVEATNSGVMVVVDHKTTGRKWPAKKSSARAQAQPAWYVAAAREMYGADDVLFAYDVMTYTGVFERRWVTVTDKHIAAVRERALQVATMYNGMRSAGVDLPPNPSSTLCSSRWCDHWDICPFGRHLAGSGNGAAIETQVVSAMEGEQVTTDSDDFDAPVTVPGRVEQSSGDPLASSSSPDAGVGAVPPPRAAPTPPDDVPADPDEVRWLLDKAKQHPEAATLVRQWLKQDSTWNVRKGPTCRNFRITETALRCARAALEAPDNFGPVPETALRELVEVVTDGRVKPVAPLSFGQVLSLLSEVEATRLGDMLRDWA